MWFILKPNFYYKPYSLLKSISWPIKKSKSKVHSYFRRGIDKKHGGTIFNIPLMNSSANAKSTKRALKTKTITHLNSLLSIFTHLLISTQINNWNGEKIRERGNISREPTGDSGGSCISYAWLPMAGFPFSSPDPREMALLHFVHLV